MIRAPGEIERLEVEVSHDWFQGVVDGLASEDRLLEGGWPGTLSDARRLLVKRLAALSIALPRPEVERSAKAIYRAAKRRWLEVASRYVSATTS